MRKEGKVWLTGAGPGDAGMITLKGLEVLKKAEVVVYDETLGDGVLSFIPQTARRIRVGDKEAEAERIRAALSEEAGAGYRVVRLMSGDPCFSGNGSGELRFLAEKGIPAELIPGIHETGVLEAAGFPLFDDQKPSMLMVIRFDGGFEDDGKTDFKLLAEQGCSLVFLCKAEDAPQILQSLKKAGMDPGTETALVTGGIRAERKIHTGTLSSGENLLEDLLPDEKSGRAVLLAGKSRFLWDEKLPLSGWKIAAAKAKGKELAVSEKLREYGAEVVELPVYSNVQMKENAYFRNAVENLEDYDWLLLTSPGSVDLFLEKLIRCGSDYRSLSCIKIACTGEWAARRLKEKGILADFVPSDPRPETFFREFADKTGDASKILFPRSGKEYQELIRELREKGNEVDAFTIGSIRLNKIETIDLKKETAGGRIQAVLFTSVPAVKGFAESAKGMDFSNIRAVCIGAQTRAAAESYGMKAYFAEKETVEGLADLFVQIRSGM